MGVARRASLVWAVALVALAVLHVSSAAQAFTVEGHEALEAAVYRRLLRSSAVDDGDGHAVSGVELLRDLIRHGALETPPCFEPASDSRRARCEQAASDRPALFWPVLGTGEPDLKTLRQFASNGQCFHFMARSEDVWTEPEDVAFGVPRRLGSEAYARCTRLLSSLFAATVRDPKAANEEYRGLYALMHAVADSFSAAHAERDAEGHIVYLKPWRLRAALPYALPTRWDAYRYLFGASHHGVVDARDFAFVQDTPACADLSHPYALPDHCFSARGEHAIEAMTDLLLTVHRVLSHADRGAHPIDAADAWRAFLQRHMSSVGDEPDIDPPRFGEREWTPAFVFGFRYRPRAIDGAHDMTATVGSALFTDVTLPLVPLLELEGGCRRIDGRCKPVLGIQTSLFVPLTEGFSLGVTPLSLLGHFGDDGEVTLGAHVIRGDLYLLDALWLSVAGPKYESLHRSFDAEMIAVSIGWAWSGKLPRDEEKPGGVRFQVDSRRLASAAPEPRGERWAPPPLFQRYQRDTVTTLVHILGGTVLPEHSDGWYSLGGLEVLWDRDRRNRRAGVALGGRVDTQYRRTRDEQFFTAIGGPVVRGYLIPDRLALELAPLATDAGYRRADGDGNAFFDVGGEASLSVMPLNRLEIGVESPRLSYRAGARVGGTNLGLRVGFALE